MLRFLLITVLLAQPLAAQDMTDLGSPPAGTYVLDKAHGRVWFEVDHLGFSTFMAPFTRFDATLQFNPDQPEAMAVTATIDATSIETFYPDASYDFNAQLTGPDFLNAGEFPQMTFTSTGVKLTGENTADVTGDFTLRGVTKPVVLHVTYNGGWGHMPLDTGGARAGFSAATTIKRSDFGMGIGVPTAEMPLGVGDEVTVRIETEFSNPDAPKP